jgi:hypothetical protein
LGFPGRLRTDLATQGRSPSALKGVGWYFMELLPEKPVVAPFLPSLELESRKSGRLCRKAGRDSKVAPRTNRRG